MPLLFASSEVAFVAVAQSTANSVTVPFEIENLAFMILQHKLQLLLRYEILHSKITKKVKARKIESVRTGGLIGTMP